MWMGFLVEARFGVRLNRKVSVGWYSGLGRWWVNQRRLNHLHLLWDRKCFLREGRGRIGQAGLLRIELFLSVLHRVDFRLWACRCAEL